MSWLKAVAIAVGAGAFILFVLSVSVWEGWLSASFLDGQSEAALAVYGVVASIGAIAIYEIDAGAD